MPRLGQDWFVVGLESLTPTSNEEAPRVFEQGRMVTLQTPEEEELGGGGTWTDTDAQA